MSEHNKTGRAKDPVDEAGGGSFPASDPPAWTATRSGKPEDQASKEARRNEDTAPPNHCEVIGLFRSPAAAQPAAAALLSAGFNRVDIGPPLRAGDLAAGLGARTGQLKSIGMFAAFGAAVAASVAALVLPRNARNVIMAAAGGAVGAASTHAARLARPRVQDPAWPRNAVLLCVKLKSPADRQRAFEILESQGACKLHVNLAQRF